jgi:hypothetical protein
MKTEFLCKWARSLDNESNLNLKTARNDQTQCNRAKTAVRFLKTRKATLDSRILNPLAGDGEEWAEILEILVEGRDIDVLPPIYSADEVWKMGLEEWRQMINLYVDKEKEFPAASQDLTCSFIWCIWCGFRFCIR